MKIDKDMMAKGYEEMAEINLEISKEFFHLEEEGEKAYEMVGKKASNEDNKG